MSDLETYSGWVEAKERCYLDGVHRAQGEVFRVEAKVLWSDDPYQPVVLLYTPVLEPQKCEANEDATIYAAGTRLPGL